MFIMYYIILNRSSVNRNEINVFTVYKTYYGLIDNN